MFMVKASKMRQKGEKMAATMQAGAVAINIIGQVSPLAGQLRRDFLTGHVESFSCL